jgi:hypothetical protein
MKKLVKNMVISLHGMIIINIKLILNNYKCLLKSMTIKQITIYIIIHIRLLN